MLASTQPIIREATKRRKVGTDENDEPIYEEYVTFSSNSKIISEYFKDLDEMMETRQSLYDKYIRKKAEGKNRADVKLGLLDRGLLFNPIIHEKSDAPASPN